MRHFMPFLLGVLFVLVLVWLSACAIGTTDTDPLPRREGGVNAMVCMMFSICNFQGSTGHSKEGSVQQESDAGQEGTITPPAPKK